MQYCIVFGHWVKTPSVSGLFSCFCSRCYTQNPLVSSLSRPTTCDIAALGSVGMLHDDVCYHSNNSDWLFVGTWEWEKIYIKREQGISRYKDGVLIVCAIEYSVALVLCLIPTLCFNCHARRLQTITQQYRVVIRFHLQWYFLFIFIPPEFSYPF